MPRFIGRKVITSPDLPDDPYLVRWTLFSCPWFQVLLHRFLRSDSAAVHDHPWSFVSLVLWRGYRETLQPSVGPWPEQQIRRRPFSIAFRRAEDRHRVVLDVEGWTPERSGPVLQAWTLVCTGPRRREWFFYPRGVRVPWRVMCFHGERFVNDMLDAGCDSAWFARHDGKVADLLEAQP
jgi:hypothetical protein